MGLNGARIRKLIESKNLSIAEFSRRINKSPQAVNNLLNGGGIRESTLTLICKVLNVSPSELYEESNKNSILREPIAEYAVNQSQNKQNVYEILADLQHRMSLLERKVIKLEGKNH